MNLVNALSLEQGISMAIVGAGGKTTAVFCAARQLPGRVLVTTTTHFGIGQSAFADEHFVVKPEDNIKDLLLNKGKVVLITGPQTNDGRWSSPTEPQLMELSTTSQQMGFSLIIEADGARGLPLKAPASHEPAIPPWVKCVLVVMGLTGLGKKLDPQFIHRPEEFARITNLNFGAEITTQSITKLALSKNGGLKNIPDRARRFILLNQADDELLKAKGGRIARDLIPDYPMAIVGSLHEHEAYQVSACYTTISAIILAAGSSLRFGKPKVLLEHEGESFIHKIARIAIDAGLSPVVIVAGEFFDQIQKAVSDLQVSVVFNTQFAAGQAISIKTGLAELPDYCGGAFFLLADQPLITSDLLIAMRERHAETMAPIIAPEIDGKRANPVLFDRTTFKDLTIISGDSGGRQIFSKFPPLLYPWFDAKVAIDIDTPRDYQQLLEMS